MVPKRRIKYGIVVLTWNTDLQNFRSGLSANIFQVLSALFFDLIDLYVNLLLYFSRIRLSGLVRFRN